MKPGRSTDSRLPRTPLLLAYPLRIPGGVPTGASLLSELPREDALPTLQALRVARSMARAQELGWRFLDARALSAKEEALIGILQAQMEESPGEERVLLQVAWQIVAEARRRRNADLGKLYWGCYCALEWALSNDAAESGFAFAEAAALVWPENARLAWIAGKLYRNHGHMREAEYWLRRAIRVAVWTKDWETKARGLIALGNGYLERGNYGRARDLHLRALRISRRHHLKEPAAMALHDLFIIASSTDNIKEAENYCRRAFEAYGTTHDNLPALAYDIAYFWLGQGHLALALPVLEAVLPHLQQPLEQLRVLASIARAAGALDLRPTFQKAWMKSWEILGDAPGKFPVSAALLELGLGASSLSEWDHARTAFESASEMAHRWEEADILPRAELALSAVQRRISAETVQHPRIQRRQCADRLATEIIQSLAALG